MKIKIYQECGQKWYRWRSWRKKNFFRKITRRVIDHVRIDDFQFNPRGPYVTGRIIKEHEEHLGFAIGPIIFTKEGCRDCIDAQVFYGTDLANEAHSIHGPGTT